MSTQNIIAVWKLKNRVHAFALIVSCLGSVVYVAQHGLLWGASWRLLLILLVHQHLMTLSHRLLFHGPGAVTWKSPLLTFTLRNWTVFFYPEGYECVKAVHDTTQFSQLCGQQCLSEAMLWFSPCYMSIKQSDFLDASYMAKHAALQLCLYFGAASSWPLVSPGLRLWLILVLCVTPVVSRVLFYLGHSFLHTPRESLLFAKSQNHVSRAYERQAYNLRLRRSRLLSKYALGVVYLGDHLHNNHHHAPNALCQGHGREELDGAYVYMRLFRSLGLLAFEEPTPVRASGESAGDPKAGFAEPAQCL